MTIDTLPTRTVIFNDVFEYSGHPPSSMMAKNNKSQCHVLIVKPEDTISSRVVVIATELHENHGKSITNSSEFLATAVCEKFSLDPEHVVFLEHYDDKISYGYDGVEGGSHYTIVEYDWKVGMLPVYEKQPQPVDYSKLDKATSQEVMYNRGFIASKPTWTRVPYEQVLRLIDTPILSAEQLLMMSAKDYIFIGIIDEKHDATKMSDMRRRNFLLPSEVPEIIPPFADLLTLKLTQTTIKFEHVLFVFGIAKDIPANCVYAAHVMNAVGVRFYAVAREFEKSL